MSEHQDEYAIRGGTLDDLEPMNTLLAEAFGHEPEPEENALEGLVFEPDRSYAMVRDGRLVAHAGAYTRLLTVPGATLPAAHVTGVAVQAAHRRKGLLTRLMRQQLAAVPESLAVLVASEGRIYQRFGYGMAAPAVRMRIDSREVGLARCGSAATGRLVDVNPAEARDDIQRVFDAVRCDRPGWSSRDARWWRHTFADSTARRSGATGKRFSLYREQDTATGYVIWRMRSRWDDSGPRGEVEVLELAALTPQAYAALWNYLLTMDLTRQVSIDYSAVDEPLRFLVDEPRRLRPTLNDGLWLRLVDVASALAGRRYAAPVDVVLEISDEFLPANAGRYRLRAGAGGVATCERTIAEPDLVSEIGALASAYLGGVSLVRLADTGRLREVRPGVLESASVAFGWHRAPAPLEMF